MSSAPHRPSASGAFRPRCDRWETAQHLVYCLDLPELSAEDIVLERRGGHLHVSGACRDPHGRFERTLALPDGVRAAEVSAHYADGRLEIVVPRPAVRTPNERIPVLAGPPKRDRSERPDDSPEELDDIWDCDVCLG